MDLNATKAAVRAGYSQRRASEIGWQLLQKTTVREAIDKAMAERAERIKVTADGVLEELRRLAMANMLDYVTIQGGEVSVDLSRLTREQAAAIQEVTVEEYTVGRGDTKRDVKRTRFKLADKRASLELLGKHLKLFTDRVEVEHDDLRNLSDEELERRLAEHYEQRNKDRVIE